MMEVLERGTLRHLGIKEDSEGPPKDSDNTFESGSKQKSEEGESENPNLS
jgi:hypothetical protein